MWFRRKPKADPSEVTRDLRNQALGVDAATLGIRPTTAHARIWGVLMETGYPAGVATLVAFGDGTASLYFSGGGGIIGAGEHAPVREATQAFLREADEHLSGFVPTGTTPLPAVGRVRFYLRTFGGTLVGEASEQDLGDKHHPLSPLFYSGQSVITAMREATDSR
jgi:hypothetical protein